MKKILFIIACFLFLIVNVKAQNDYVIKSVNLFVEVNPLDENNSIQLESSYTVEIEAVKDLETANINVGSIGFQSIYDNNFEFTDYDTVKTYYGGAPGTIIMIHNIKEGTNIVKFKSSKRQSCSNQGVCKMSFMLSNTMYDIDLTIKTKMNVDLFFSGVKKENIFKENDEIYGVKYKNSNIYVTITDIDKMNKYLNNIGKTNNSTDDTLVSMPSWTKRVLITLGITTTITLVIIILGLRWIFKKRDSIPY